ncbi:VOC family protein [Streptosporangium soli]|nr:VOC family protein [Streptosporangium sp. KLBMP 9127]
MSHDIGHLHHVGVVVRDLGSAIEVYRRMGFLLPAPSCPSMPPEEGAAPRPFGAANTHIAFRRNFVELVTALGGDGSGRLPADTNLVPLVAPAEALPRLTEIIDRTVANLETCLARFDGLHILMCQTPDAEALATRLTDSGVGHGGVNVLRRKVETPAGSRLDPIRYLEIDGAEPDLEPGRVPEGRVGMAEDIPPGADLEDHPNGAVELVDVVLCVAEPDLVATEKRYAAYLGRAARSEGTVRVFDLEGSRVTLVADTELDRLLPGERPPALPAFVAFAVAVGDQEATRSHLQENGFPVMPTPSGDVFVPAASALGAAVVFRRSR